MAIDLKKNEDELRKAWKAVIDDSNEINWALFTYEKHSNHLSVLNTGSNGLEELIDELNVANIMYAFCRVQDPKTGLAKYVLINWQGEGAPLGRKGICANHIHDVSNFFRGAHITVNARNEDEAEPNSILQRVSMASSTKYNFKERSDPTENIAPVGTNYRRVQPQKEINLSERENFWTKQQDEEKRRKVEERKKLEEAKMKMEAEQREREMKAAKEREILVQQKDEEILKRKEAEKNAENVARNELSRRLSFGSHENEEEEKAAKQRQDEIAKQRGEEMKTLMSQRSVKNARALFEQNTSAGQLSSVKASDRISDRQSNRVISQMVETKQPEIKSVKSEEVVTPQAVTPIVTQTAASNVEKEKYVEEGAVDDDDEEEEEEEECLEEEVYDVRQISQAMDAMRYDINIPHSEPLEDIAEEAEEGPEEQTTGKIFEDHMDLEKEVFSVLDQGLKARALYDYQAADETEISFDPDDIITHIEQIDEGWWQGMGPDGTYGLFPANYVELID